MEYDNDGDKRKNDDETAKLLEAREKILRQLAELEQMDESDNDDNNDSVMVIPRKGPKTPPDPPPDSPSVSASDVSVNVDEMSRQRRSDDGDGGGGGDDDEDDDNAWNCGENQEDVRTEMSTSLECPFTSELDAELEEMIEAPVEMKKTEEEVEGVEEKVKTYKTVLERVDYDRFNPLPSGWIMIIHSSGMPMFFHKATRVISISRPYRVDEAIRSHQVPMSAIPCLYRKTLLEKEAEKKKRIEKIQENIEEAEKSAMSKLADQILVGANAGIIDNHEDFILNAEKFREYCAKLFKFKQVLVKKGGGGGENGTKPVQRYDRRVGAILHKAGFNGNYDEIKNMADEHDLVISAPSGGVLIDITPLEQKRNGTKKPFLLNPMGRTTVPVLNEFVQRLVRGKVDYECEDNRNVSCPYKATAWLTIKKAAVVQIGGNAKEKLSLLKEQAELAGCSTENDSESRKFPIGRGIGHSKKVAKLVAAKDALAKLIPSLHISEDNVCDGVREKKETDGKGYDEEAMELFDRLKIDSKNVVVLCTKFGLIKPFNLLKEAVTKSIRWNGQNLEVKKSFIGNGAQLSKVELKLGDIEQEAEATGVKVAMQVAAQMLLKKMHPELESYGSFLRLYGGFEDKILKEMAKKHHDEVVRLQNKGNHLQPNHAVLSKLREEMKRVSIIHPPRQFLYGLAPTMETDAITKKRMISTATQTLIEKNVMASTATPMVQMPNLLPMFVVGAPPPPPPPPPPQSMPSMPSMPPMSSMPSMPSMSSMPPMSPMPPMSSMPPMPSMSLSLPLPLPPRTLPPPPTMGRCPMMNGNDSWKEMKRKRHRGEEDQDGNYF